MHPQSADIPARSTEMEQFIDQFLSTVCDSSRRHILECLTTPDGSMSALPERSVGEIASHVGLAVSTTSEHLKELLQVHLLSSRKDGKRTYYRLRNHEMVRVFHEMLVTLEEHYHHNILPPPENEKKSG